MHNVLLKPIIFLHKFFITNFFFYLYLYHKFIFQCGILFYVNVMYFIHWTKIFLWEIYYIILIEMCIIAFIYFFCCSIYWLGLFCYFFLLFSALYSLKLFIASCLPCWIKWDKIEERLHLPMGKIYSKVVVI